MYITSFLLDNDISQLMGEEEKMPLVTDTNVEKVIQLLADTKKLLDKNNINFWLMYGTLLGFVRNKQFIPWDHDIDISAWYNDYDKIKNLKDEFKKIGYEMTFQEGEGSPVTIYPSKEDAESHSFHLDILFWIKDKDLAVELIHFNRSVFDRLFDGLGRMLNQDYYKGRHTSLSKNTRNKTSKIVSLLSKRKYNFLNEVIHSLYLFTCKKTVMPYAQFNEIKTINAYKTKFNIPSNYEQFLELTYGLNWKIPDKNYSSEKWIKNNKSIIKYQIKDKKVKDLWAKRYNK